MCCFVEFKHILQNSAEVKILILMTIDIQLFLYRIIIMLYNFLLTFMFDMSGLVPSSFQIPKKFTSLLKYHKKFVAVLEGKLVLDAG